MSRPADFNVMPASVRFADLLDDKLRAIEFSTPPRDDFRNTAAPQHVVYTPLYNLHTVTQRLHTLAHGAYSDTPAAGADVRAGGFAAAERGVESGNRATPSSEPAVDAAHQNDGREWTRPVFREMPPIAAAPPRPAAPRRRLTAMQWRSLDTFNRLGASLPVDFSAGDLRSAFRLLARRYHPDRHPGATAPDRQRLAQQFTSLRTSYEALLTALESAAA